MTLRKTLSVGQFFTLVLGASLAFAACTVTTDDDVDDDDHFGTGATGGGVASGGMGGDTGTGGETTSGGSGGTASGGTVATGGMGGDVATLDCHLDDTVQVTPSPTDEPNDEACLECARTQCADEYANCYATSPDSACGWDLSSGPGEFGDMDKCFQALAAANNFVGDDTDVETCAAVSAADSCGTVSATSVTIALSECMVGLTGDDPNGCQDECDWVNPPM